MTKLLMGVGSFVGGILGGYVPGLWGEDGLSVMGILCGSIGAIIGIICGYKLARRLGFS
jgi:uncharacterized membrane protein